MKKILFITLMAVAFSSSLLAREVPCRFSVKANDVAWYVHTGDSWEFDGASEAELLRQGLEVTRNKERAHFEIFMEYSDEHSDFWGVDYNKKTKISVYRSYDGVLVYRNERRGKGVRVKGKLIDEISDLGFSCI